MNNAEIAKKVKECFANQTVITTQEITEVLAQAYPDLSASTISWRVNQLKKEGFIFQVGRGLYSLDYKPEYVPELSLKTKRQYNRIKAFYTGDLVVWDSAQLFALADQEPTKHWIFLAIPKEDLETLFDKMLDLSRQVFLQPDKEIITRYLLPQPEAIILVPLISETPLYRVNDYLTPTLEGLLVNTCSEADEYMESLSLKIVDVFKNAFIKYNVNQSKLLRYAARRDKREEIEKLITTLH